MDTLFDKSNNKFYPENQEGNIEYKWRLDTKNELGHKKLISQMMWRINEGFELIGEKKAGYLIGVYDDGSLGELSVDKLIDSINIFKNIIKKADVKIKNEEIKMINESYVYYATIIKEDNIKINEKNLIIIGESQSGKTTLISQMCYNSNIKNYVLKHIHEKISGTTTDIKKEIIGIKQNKIINYSEYGGWDDIVQNSDIVINIYDIPVLNIKSIINYLLGIDPDYIIICYNDILDKINKPDLKFYSDFCQFYNIKYQFVNSELIRNYDKNYFNDILFNISNFYKDKLNKNYGLFRIIDYYNIPEKGIIVSGLQINNEFKDNDEVYFVTNNNTYKIIIKSIHKKMIKTTNIKSGESGSFNIEFIDKFNINKNNTKLSKNSYIIDKNDYIKECKKEYNFKNNKIINGKYNNTIIFNGNMIYNTKIEIKDNMIYIESDIFIQDNKLIFSINNLEFNDLILCMLDL